MARPPNAPPHTCPYAAAAAAASSNAPPPSSDAEHEWDDQASSTSYVGSPSPSHPPTNEMLLDPNVAEAFRLAKSSCPAFRDGGCPFSSATNADDVRIAMLSVPTSHYAEASSSSDGDKGGGGGGNASNEAAAVGVFHPSASSSASGRGTGEATATTAPPGPVVPFRLALEHVHRVSTSLSAGHGVSLPSPPMTSVSTAGHIDGAQRSNGIDEQRPTLSASSDNVGVGDGAKDRHYVLEGGCPFKTFYRKRNDGQGGSMGEETREPFVDALERLSFGAILARMADDEFRRQESKQEQTKEEEVSQAATTKVVDVAVEADANEGTSTATVTVPKEKEHDAAAAATTTTITHRAVRRRSSGSATLLSAALKMGTAESHAAAENVHFVKDFIKGKIDKDLYRKLVTNLYHVYETLERELNKHGPTVFPALHYPDELARVDSLEDDMEYWHGINWRESSEAREPSRATQEYCRRIEDVAKSEPLLLLAHGYTRYLGDLSGGKILARVARKALGLQGSHDGLRFYYFKRIPNAKAFKDAYRIALDGLELDSDRVARLVAEANVAFVLNMRLFEELDVAGGVEGAVVRDVKEALSYFDRVVEEQERRRSEESENGSDVDGKDRGATDAAFEGVTANAAKCPFAFAGGPNPHRQKVPTPEMSGGALKETAPAVPALFEVQRDGKAPMDTMAATSNDDEGGPAHASSDGGRCPWPFIFFHDPWQGLQDWQTWVVLGLAFCWVWSVLQQRLGLGAN